MILSNDAKEGWINLFLVIGFAISAGVLFESQPIAWIAFFVSLLIIRNS